VRGRGAHGLTKDFPSADWGPFRGRKLSEVASGGRERQGQGERRDWGFWGVAQWVCEEGETRMAAGYGRTCF